jgi:importin subunit beta-1
MADPQYLAAQEQAMAAQQALAAQEAAAAEAQLAALPFDHATVAQALANAQSADGGLRTQAEAYLQHLEASNVQLFFELLVTEFATVTSDPSCRMLAGIMLKNAVHAEADALQVAKAQRWLELAADFRTNVKAGLLTALADETLPLRRTAASVIGRVGFIELPLEQWPECIPQLVANVQQDDLAALKHGSLEAIGFVCEDIEPEILEAQSNEILTAVCKGCTDTDTQIKISGLTALINSLAFVRANMDRKMERDYIMQVIQDSAVHEDEEVRVVALEALGQVATLYYDKLQDYMQKVFNLTLEVIRKDEEAVALQAIEFWSTICDEEIYLLDLFEDAQEAGEQPERVSQNYVRGALQYLVPLLTDTLTKQDDEPDEDEWTPPMAAGTCLSLVAQTVADEVVQYVMPFVQRSITSEDWKFREAATLAFGSILDGPPSSDAMVQLISRAIPLLTQQMKDPVSYVKDTTAWTLGRILELYGEEVVATNQLPAIATELLAALDDSPKIAATSCWAIHNLAATFEEVREGPTSGLSPYYETYLTKLLEISNRMDAGEKNLRTSAYETISQVISSGAQDTLPILERGMPTFIERLAATFQLEVVSTDDRDLVTELQSLLCGVFQVSVQRLGAQALNYADGVMQLCLQVFNTKDAIVHEEALMCVGAVADACGVEFERYMEPFFPSLVAALANADEASTCIVAVGCLGDVARALDARIAPYNDQVVEVLLLNLQSQTISRDIKPPILSAFGDLALASSAEFTKYIERVVQVLMAAGTTVADPDDYDMVDFVNKLRQGILDAFTGIIQGLRGDPNNTAIFGFGNYVEDVLQLVSQVSTDPIANDACKAASAGLIGDIASAFGAKFSAMLTAPWVAALLDSCATGNDRACIQSAAFARHELANLR